MAVSAPPPPPFKDRSFGLAVFGTVLIFLGVGSLWAATAMPLTFRGAHMSASIFRLLGSSINGSEMIWLGFGSVLARRWAASLLLCLGGVHFVLTILEMPGSLILMLNDVGGRALEWGLAIRFLLPAAQLAFYSHPDVKRTCELRDPTERWTEQCPLPVLGCCVLLCELAMQDFENCVTVQPLPFFGSVISGPSGQGLWLATALFTLYAVWGIYRFDRRDWTVYLVVFLIFNVSVLLTLARIRSVQGISLTPEYGDQMWIEIADLLTGLGYLICARFYFPTPQPPARALR
jgi:hypothetical protein